MNSSTTRAGHIGVQAVLGLQPRLCEGTDHASVHGTGCSTCNLLPGILLKGPGVLRDSVVKGLGHSHYRGDAPCKDHG